MKNVIFSSFGEFVSYVSNIVRLPNDTLRVEVKWFKGRFIPYGKPTDPHNTAFENAVDYITNPRHADYYALPFITRGGKGRPGKLYAAVYTRDAILKAVKAADASGQTDYGALGLHNGGVAIMRAEELTMRQTFGMPELLLETGMSKRADLKPDRGCPNAPYARAWEKVISHLMGAKWVGGLRNVQIDVMLNLGDE